LRIPIDPQADVSVKATFTVGETVLGGEAKYQRPVFWMEAEGSGDQRFDFSVCGVLVTGNEVKLQHGLRERPAPQHPQRLRTRLGTKINGGEQVLFQLAKTVDGGALLLHDAASSGRQGIAMPPRTRIVALHVSLPREADFPKVGGQRDKTRPGAWQPLYGWVLEDLTINGQRVLEGGGGEPSAGAAPDPTREPDPIPDPLPDPDPPLEIDPRIDALRTKLQAIRDLVDDALGNLDGD